ncbi:unnamed protein product [Rhodiola kirilowii]
MEVNQVVKSVSGLEDEEEAQAKVEIWRYVFGFVEMAVVKCAIELQIPDILEGSNKPMTLQELASATSSDPQLLYRIMRFLINRRIFKEKIVPSETSKSKGYVQTPLSRLLTTNGLSGLVLLESSPVMIAPWHYLGRYLTGKVSSSFVGAHGVDIWSYAAAQPEHCDLISLSMAGDARLVMPAILNGCPEVFDGVRNVVDVGGADGTALSILLEACPWIHGINFDLPHVASTGLEIHNVEHIGGDMFVEVPKADVALIKWVLHDWGDEECIQILTKCREAVPVHTGKVIIIESVLDEESDHGENKLKDTGLMLDICMMAHTNKGKERTLPEWKHILDRAGLAKHDFKPIPGAVQSLIQAFP